MRPARDDRRQHEPCRLVYCAPDGREEDWGEYPNWNQAKAAASRAGPAQYLLCEPHGGHILLGFVPMPEVRIVVRGIVVTVRDYLTVYPRPDDDPPPPAAQMPAPVIRRRWAKAA